MIAVLLFGILFVLLFLGVPIAVSLGVSTAAAMVITGNINLLPAITQRMFYSDRQFYIDGCSLFYSCRKYYGEGWDIKTFD